MPTMEISDETYERLVVANNSRQRKLTAQVRAFRRWADRLAEEFGGFDLESAAGEQWQDLEVALDILFDRITGADPEMDPEPAPLTVELTQDTYDELWRRSHVGRDVHGSLGDVIARLLRACPVLPDEGQADAHEHEVTASDAPSVWTRLVRPEV